MPNTDKVVALHIGAHKTGTSVVQRYLHDRAAALRRRRVAVLSRTEFGRLVGWGPPLVENPQALTDRLERFARSPWYTTLIGSNENVVGKPFPAHGSGRLYPDGPGIIAALGRATAGRPVRVILSIRPQDEFLESYYLQTVHQGGHETFRDWFSRLDPEALSWRPLVDALHDAVGRRNVEIVDFRRLAEGQSAFVQHVLQRADPRLRERVRFERPLNRSVSARGLQLALAVNPLLENPAERRAVRVFLQENFSNLSGARPSLLTDTERAAIRTRYAAEYDELVRAPGTHRDVRARLSGAGHAATIVASAQTPSPFGVAVARVVVDVVLKPEILDPQGQAIVGALGRLGIEGVHDVRQGKHFELDVADGLDDATLTRLADTLLANPVIETFSIRRG